VLFCRKPGDRQDFLKYTMSDVRISSYQMSSHTAGGLANEVGLSFKKLEIEYATQKPDGSLGAPIKADFDVQAGTATTAVGAAEPPAVFRPEVQAAPPVVAAPQIKSRSRILIPRQ
ncbi:MAG: type VI secretion system tube protein Hcp, partial [Armatimonadota bacterium]|nr:type VI secretion system tube protein Hcp [Armatimonadota bacterium]